MTDVQSTLSGGFAEASVDAARSFRAALKALSRPGLLVPLRADLMPPRPMSAEVAALLLTLTDSDTPVWLAPALDNSALRQWIAFHTGSPVVADPARAMFAVARKDDAHSYIASLDLGTAEYPDRAATLILELPELGTGPMLALTGPGIESEITLTAALPADIVASLERNAELYPLGLDIVLAAPGAIVGLPRSTRIVCSEAR